jgi:hypothetical protein
MLIDVANGVIYHFDTYCTMDGLAWRKMRIKKIVSIIVFQSFKFLFKQSTLRIKTIYLY